MINIRSNKSGVLNVFQARNPYNGYMFTRTPYHCYGLHPESNSMTMNPKKYIVLVLLARKCINMHCKSCAPPTGSTTFS